MDHYTINSGNKPIGSIMIQSQILNNFFKSLKPHELPPHFLASVTYENSKGETISLTGDDIVKFMKSYKVNDIEYFQTRLNVSLIMEAIAIEKQYIMDEVDKLKE